VAVPYLRRGRTASLHGFSRRSTVFAGNHAHPSFPLPDFGLAPIDAMPCNRLPVPAGAVWGLADDRGNRIPRSGGS
jgi:hypothetical protein